MVSGDGAAFEAPGALAEPWLSRVLPPDMLAAESNHRIANNLAMIAALLRRQSREVALSGRTYTAAEVMAVLKELSERIDTVGRFHRLLAQPASEDTLELGAYLEEVTATAIASMAREDEISLVVNCEGGVRMRRTRALLVGFILGELVTNAVKYAYPAPGRGQLRLACAADHQAVRVSLADDGAGMPEGFDPARSGGLGLRLARLMSQELDASLAFASGGLGVTARLVVPHEPVVRTEALLQTE